MEREEILERLVALHDERVEEERAGHVRWLRPEYQIPRFGGGVPTTHVTPERAPVAAATAQARAWPDQPQEQIAAITQAVNTRPGTPGELASQFANAPEAAVTKYLELLEVLGQLVRDEDGRYHAIASR